MKLQKLLAGITILSIFVVGCNSNKIKQDNAIDEEAIYQKTMTKVQNDVSEIINKDYEYVINNMGSPYCTTYYIDSEKIRNLDMLDESYQVKNMRLVYPKYTADNKLDGSALYIEIENNKVSDVQTYELEDYDKEIEKQIDKPDIILNKYSDDINLPLNKVEKIDLKTYIGQNEKEIYNTIGNIKPNFEAFQLDTDQKVEIYMLNEINKDDSKLLIIYEKANTIEDIGVVNNNIVNLVKDYLNR